jgi:hypothetical protein
MQLVQNVFADRGVLLLLLVAFASVVALAMSVEATKNTRIVLMQ